MHFLRKIQSKYVKEQEADAMRKAMRKTDIPQEYRHLPIIGEGNTTIVVEKDPETVIMLTRDAIKKDWLHFGLRISKGFQVHDVKTRRRDFSEFSVYAIEMPKLFKVGPANKKKINEELRYFDAVLSGFGLAPYQVRKRENLAKVLRKYEDEGKENSAIYVVLDWLQNYDESMYHFDFAKRQFLEDKQGNLVLVDPVVESDLLEVMKGLKS